MRFSTSGFFHKSVVPGPLIHILKYFCHLLLFCWVIGLWIKNIRVPKHGDFLISVFQYMEIQKYSCIETWRFKNFRVLYAQIFFKRPIIRRNNNRWWKYFRVWLGTTNLWKNQGLQISCYCPFKGIVSSDQIGLLMVTEHDPLCSTSARMNSFLCVLLY